MADEDQSLREEEILFLEATELKQFTLYHFGKLGLLTGREFVISVFNTINDAGLKVVKK